jgi:hypothetical protein
MLQFVHTNQGPQMYKLLNTKTGLIVGTYSTMARARAARDRLDNAYGAYVHTIKGDALPLL